MGCRWLLIACLMLLLQVSFEATSEQSSGKSGKRQTKPRNVGFFGLVRNFVRDTIADTSFVVRNITDIVNNEFPPASAQAEGRNQTSTSGARIPTLPQVTNLLGRNYRALMKLFNQEFRQALTDSRKNVQTYRKEFKDAVRPYFTAGGFTSTTTPRSTS